MRQKTYVSKNKKFRCKLPNYENDSYEIQSDYHQQLVDKYVPFDKNNSLLNELDKCKLYEFNNINDTFSNSTYTCDSWVFSRKYYHKTIVNDVCNKKKNLT